MLRVAAEYCKVEVNRCSDARIHWMANRLLASNAIVNSRLTECHGCWHVILWDLQSIRLSNRAELLACPVGSMGG